MSSIGGHHDAAREAAAAVSHRVKRHIATEERSLEYGTVRSIGNPMQVELHSGNIVIEEGYGLFLTQLLRWWNLNFTIQVDDVLVLAPMPDETWVAIDIRTDRAVAAGVRPSRPPAAAEGDMRDAEASTEAGLFAVDFTGHTVTWAHHIVKKLEVYDAAGNRIGWVPVFDSLP